MEMDSACVTRKPSYGPPRGVQLVERASDVGVDHVADLPKFLLHEGVDQAVAGIGPQHLHRSIAHGGDQAGHPICRGQVDQQRFDPAGGGTQLGRHFLQRALVGSNAEVVA